MPWYMRIPTNSNILIFKYLLLTQEAVGAKIECVGYLIFTHLLRDMKKHSNEQLYDIAERQQGLFTARQAVAAGV